MAYHPPTDLCLVLEVARLKYASYWLKMDDLYKATRPSDPAMEKSRGYVLVYHPNSRRISSGSVLVSGSGLGFRLKNVGGRGGYRWGTPGVIVVGLQRQGGGDNSNDYGYRDSNYRLNRQGQVEEAGRGGKTRERMVYMSPEGDNGRVLQGGGRMEGGSGRRYKRCKV